MSGDFYFNIGPIDALIPNQQYSIWSNTGPWVLGPGTDNSLHSLQIVFDSFTLDDAVLGSRSVITSMYDQDIINKAIINEDEKYNNETKEIILRFTEQ